VRLLAKPVASVARLVNHQLVIAATQVVRQLGLQYSFNQGLCKLLEQAAVPRQILATLVVCQQRVYQLCG